MMNDYQYITLCEDLEYERDQRQSFIENEMHTQKEEVLESLSRIVAHSYTESFAKILLYSWSEGFEEAEKIASQLHLSKLDFLSLSGNVKEYEEEFLKEQSWDFLE